MSPKHRGIRISQQLSSGEMLFCGDTTEEIASKDRIVLRFTGSVERMAIFDSRWLRFPLGNFVLANCCRGCFSESFTRGSLPLVGLFLNIR